MSKEKFNEIIDFAVAREQEAVQFYRELQQMVNFKSHRDVLKQYEEMEKGHIVILEKMRQEMAVKIGGAVPRVENLLISDYLVESKPTAQMTYQDILIIAMKREEKANKLYTKLADESSDSEVKKVFLRIASEEAMHKNLFEKIYDKEILKDN